jgi:hypothetical protein
VTGNSLIDLFILVVLMGLLFWLCIWFLDWVAIPEPFNKVAKVVLGLAILIFLLSRVMPLLGVNV